MADANLQLSGDVLFRSAAFWEFNHKILSYVNVRHGHRIFLQPVTSGFLRVKLQICNRFLAKKTEFPAAVANLRPAQSVIFFSKGAMPSPIRDKLSF
jgi:hypothetical protein